MKYLEDSLTFASPLFTHFVETLLFTSLSLYNKKNQKTHANSITKLKQRGDKTCILPWAFAWEWPLASWTLLTCLHRNKSHPCLPASPSISTRCHSNKSIVAAKHSSSPTRGESANSLQPKCQPIAGWAFRLEWWLLFASSLFALEQ